MNLPTKTLTFTVSLSFEAHLLAEHYRRQQTHPQKAKQAYLNALAMYAVNFYCQCMGYETNQETSDSSPRLMQKFLEVADLNIKQFGKLECRPVLHDADILQVPAEAWNDRIAYIAVQLNQSLKQAILLGFAPSVAEKKGIIPLNELYSLADFPNYFAEFSQVTQKSLFQLVNLSNWLTGIVETGWQTINEQFELKELTLASAFRRRTLKLRSQTKEELIEILQTTEDEEIRWEAAELLWEIDPNNPASGVRKVADLGFQLAARGVALMVGILPKSDRSLAILLRVYPMGNQSYLPAALQLIGLDEAGTPFFEVQAREQDHYIQFKFTAEPGDQFSVKVALDGISITEHFII
ncbi:MAG: DUF1822 family protein [Microcoleus vaginatus WJT46-NPBG5]|jgi:hypothetical protein|nr:DUF1822 family protein [Microcoleus vaginatus WJT46-NPBG5]